jgi:branched-chain amino acid aminotransferase
VKSTSYAENVHALAHARAGGFGEAIFLDTQGHLCEGTGSNLFVVRDGLLLTPSTANGCLAGIVRELLLELLDVTERADLVLDDLVAADEAFLTSSTRDVQPIAEVDGKALASVPGPITVAAAAAIESLQTGDLDP